MFKKIALLLFLSLSVSDAFAQRIVIRGNQNDTTLSNASAESRPISADTEYSIGIDAGYLAIAGFAPIVLDADFSDHYTAQLGLGPTFNEGVLVMAFDNAWSGGPNYDYKLGLGGYGRVKAYYHERDDREGIWAPYVAAGYEYTVWNKEAVNSSGNFAYRRESRSLSAFSFLVGARKRYRWGGFVDCTLGISSATSRSEGTTFSTNNTSSTVNNYILPAANLVLGVYLGE